MRPAPKPSAAAWVPGTMDLAEAAGLAVEWLEATRTANDGRPVLVTPGKTSYDGIAPIEDFKARAQWTTVLSKSLVDPGPALVYVPVANELEYAMRLARGKPICVVETASFPLAGWAQELGAINLLNPEEAVAELQEAALKELDRLEFYGNNAWSDTFGKQQASRILPTLLQLGVVDDTLDGRMIARGASDRGVKNLRKLIEKMR